MPDTSVGLMAKFPQLGRVKTRLSRTVSPERALEVYKWLLNRTCHLIVVELKPPRFHRAAFVTPADNTADFRANYPGFDSYTPQEGTDLGCRMRTAIDYLIDTTATNRVILIGADCPELTAEHILQASDELTKSDLVLGPAYDGGYYLVGVREIHAELFAGIAWGTADVLAETLMVADRLGLSTVLLKKLRDLDDETDYEYFNQNGLLTYNRGEQ